MRRCLLELPDFICLILVYFAVLLPRWRGDRKGLLFRTAFYVYLCFVLHFTLLPLLLPTRVPSLHINWIPFRDVMNGYRGAQKQIVLNFIMTVPFGVFLPLIYRKRFFSTAGLTLALSLGIEFLQLFSGDSRIADITDVLTNTLGGMAGYLLFLPLSKAALSGEKPAPADKTAPKAVPKREKAVWAIFLCQILVKSFLAAIF
ncbi:MAG: hypothetical protein ACFWUD_04425 [Thermocaproicibacter melissae]|jgi:glycopeptide antibiotics resistance protein|uniref:VanZ family protein n=1 Tax=Thermocaproicibacter melissae TaxID=2966552 RepID=UPI0024B2589A|nr:VanZ family protein [Thermocaproicibacter melissae]WBY64374.1 VanZ family protein [Thermocaproicibacter melissae]